MNYLRVIVYICILYVLEKKNDQKSA